MVRAIARAMMPEFIRLGVSRRGVQRYLQSRFGQAYKWDTLRRDYNEFLGIKYFKDAWNRLSAYEKPQKYMYVEADLPAARNYYYKMRASFEDVETGEYFERWISMYDASSRSEYELLEIMEQLYGKTEYHPNHRLLGFEETQFFHHRGMLY